VTQVDERLWLRRLALVLLVVGVLYSYVFFASIGRISEWTTHTTFNDWLAEGFRLGQLDLNVRPNELLLQQADPFEHHHRWLWIWDASLYKGRYYNYWGPLPAALIAAGKVLFGVPSTVPIGDHYPGFAFAALTFVCLALLVDELGRKLYRVPLWLSACTVLVVAYAYTLPTLLARLAVYESAILGGQAFLLAGVLLAARTLLAPDGVRDRASLRWVAVGTCWAAAIVCRLSLAPTAALLAIATALASTPRPWTWRALVAPLARLAVPLALAGSLLLVYNRARFDSFFDFGVTKQLSTLPFQTGPQYLLANLYSYFLRPMQTDCRFPFFLPVEAVEEMFPSKFHFADGYMFLGGEPVIGLLYTCPWVALALYGAYDFARAFAKLRGTEARAALGYMDSVRLWAGFSALVISVVGASAVLMMFIATMRYAADFRQGVLLLGALGAFRLHEQARGRGRAQRYAVNAFIIVCATYTFTVGGLLGFDSYYHQFAASNPALYHSLVNEYSFCAAP